MKKVLYIIFIVSGLAFFVFFSNTYNAEAKPIIIHHNPVENSNNKLCFDALSALLHPHIQKAIDDLSIKHSEYHGGIVDPWDTKVLSVERIPNQTSKLWFYIKVEVQPYVLAHNSVGRDHITFMLMPTGEVILEKIERIENYNYSREKAK